jgi:hypothetical protein
MKDELKKAIELIKVNYMTRLPNGSFNISYPCLGDKEMTNFIHLGMIADRYDCPHGIKDNDKAKGLFIVEIENNQLVITRHYHQVSCLPTQQFMAMSHKSVKFRKLKAQDAKSLADKFAKYLDTFIVMLKAEIKENRIYGQSEVKEIYLNNIN